MLVKKLILLGVSYLLLILLSIGDGLLHTGLGSKDEANLVRKLFNGSIPYNPLIRPAVNITDIIKVKLSLSFIQLIRRTQPSDEVQYLAKYSKFSQLNLLDLLRFTDFFYSPKKQWHDFQLVWNKSEHGGIEIIRMIPEMVWQPDIVLFNNADGKYEVSYKSRVLITHDGLVQYIPPAIYRSSCRIDVKYFPFDQQTCELKFGSWTFNADQVDLDFANDFKYVDLSDYVISGTWDVIDCPGVMRRFRGWYSTPNRTRIDYKIVLRRKTLFYTVNLIIPCVLISLLSICVFYLPADEGEKMTLSISILLALVVFLLLLQKILPPTSTSIPLIASYLLFTMILNVFSILITVVIINCSFRTPRTHTMPQWVYTFFIERLSRVLLMSRQPKGYNANDLPQSNVEEAEVIAARQFSALETNLLQGSSRNFGFPVRSSLASKMYVDEIVDESEFYNHIKGSKRKKVNRQVTYQNVIATMADPEFSLLPPGKKKQVTIKTVPSMGTNYGRSGTTTAPTRPSLKPSLTFQGTANKDEEDDEKIWISFEDQLEQLLSTDSGREVAVTKELYKSVKAIRYIARHIRQSDAHDAVLKDWKYIGLVMDRLLLIIFLIVTISGTIGIFMESPHIFDFVEQQEVIDRLTQSKEQHKMA